MSAKRFLGRLVVIVVALTVLTTIAVGPALAADDVSVGSEGLTVGGDDGISIDIGDDGGPNAGGDAAADLGPDEQTIAIAAAGSDGTTATGVRCEVSADSTGTPCEQVGESGGEAPSPPDGIVLPPDPSLPGGDGGQAPGLPGGSPAPSFEQNRYGYSTGLPEVGGIVAAEVITGDRGIDEASVGFAGEQETEQVEHATAYLGPSNGVAILDYELAAEDRTVGTRTSCYAGGWLRPCTVRNEPPVYLADTPLSDVEQIPGAVYVIVDGFVLRSPTGVPGFAVGTVGQEVPAESPVNPGNPPYEPYQRPFDYTRPEEALNPGVTPTSSEGSTTILGGTATLTDDHWSAGGIGIHDPSSPGIEVGLVAADGQNYHQLFAMANGDGLRLRGTGFVNGGLTLTQEDQSGSGQLDLGGQPYGFSIPPEEGGSGGLPDDPTNPEIPEAPAGDLPSAPA